MPHPRRQSLRCHLMGHKPYASEWQEAGRDRFWVRVIWCGRCGTYRREAHAGSVVAPSSLVSPL